jgi:hypothetical protein
VNGFVCTGPQALGDGWGLRAPPPAALQASAGTPGPAAQGRNSNLIPAVVGAVVAALVAVLAVAVFVNRRRRKAPPPAARERFVWVRPWSL